MTSQPAKVATRHRQNTRYPAHYRELLISYEGYSEQIPLRPPDLSVQGMFIQTARHFHEGAVLKVQFRLANSLYEVNVRAEVRYCLRGVGIGIEFVDISPEASRAIRDELRALAVPADDSI